MFSGYELESPGKNETFLIKNEKLCIKNEELCIEIDDSPDLSPRVAGGTNTGHGVAGRASEVSFKNDRFCIQNGGFCIQNGKTFH